MSLGHARPKLTHMPHLLAAKEEASAARFREMQSGHTPEHPCQVCGRIAPFGFNNFRRAPELAIFACREHRAEVQSSLT